MDKIEVLKKIKELKDTNTSEELNQWYTCLKDLIKKEPNEDSQILKAQLFLKKLVHRALKKKLKTTENLKGSLEFQLLKEDKNLRVQKSKWARKRGLRFEQTLKSLLNFLLDSFSMKGLIYRNHISKFEAQPYDLIFFRPNLNPVLFECKASGITLNKNAQVKLSADSRRYVNHRIQLTKILKFLDSSCAPLYFAFLNDSTNQVYFVKHKVILDNLQTLSTRRVSLDQTQYRRLSLDPEKVPLEVFKDFLQFLL